MPTTQLYGRTYEVGPTYNLSTTTSPVPLTHRTHDKVYVVAHDTDVTKGGWVVPAPYSLSGQDLWVAISICDDKHWGHSHPGDGVANTLRNAVLVAQFEDHGRPRRGDLHHCIRYLSNPIERF